VPADGAVIAYDANPFVKRVIENLPNAITFGLNESCDYYASDIDFDSEGMPSFKVNHGGKVLCEIKLSVPGEHNILNALSAFVCCHILDVDVEDIVNTLKTFKGTQRRFDILGKTTTGIKVIDDYAHHPTEIKATLSAVKNMKHNNLWCLFQPHTYTRTMALMDDFATSFEEADKIVLAEIYAAREKNIHKVSSKSLMNKIKEADPTKDVYFFKDFDEIANFVYNNAEEGDLVITMGAGDIYKVGEMILEKDKKF
jgi:UDP-N-acetylmuramate--alanine ligase